MNFSQKNFLLLVQFIAGSNSKVTVPEGYDKYVGSQGGEKLRINTITNTNTNISNGSTKDVNNGYKIVGDWGQYTILEKDGKKYKKHKWKDEPIKDYE